MKNIVADPIMEKKTLAPPGFAEAFKEMSSAHSWYKHLVGDEVFVIYPALPKTWTITQDLTDIAKLPAEIREIVSQNKVMLNPFVFTGDAPLKKSGFRHTVGIWGWPMLEYLSAKGYTEEVDLLRKELKDNAYASGANIGQVKVTYESDLETNPIITKLYEKEYERMSVEASKAASSIFANIMGIFALRVRHTVHQEGSGAATKPQDEEKLEGKVRLIYNIILTFDGQEQEIFDMSVVPNLTEEEFVAAVFACAPTSIANLVKISSCMTSILSPGTTTPQPFTEQEAKKYFPTYMEARNGKFYFNPDVNTDADTKKWFDYRNAHVKKHVRSRSDPLVRA